MIVDSLIQYSNEALSLSLPPFPQKDVHKRLNSSEFTDLLCDILKYTKDPPWFIFRLDRSKRRLWPTGAHPLLAGNSLSESFTGGRLETFGFIENVKNTRSDFFKGNASIETEMTDGFGPEKEDLTIMSTELETIGRRDGGVHYINAGVHCLVGENFEGHYLQQGDLSLEEVLEDQASYVCHSWHSTSLYRSSSDLGENNHPRAMERGRESSSITNIESQLELDEALARALQDLENASLSETDDEISPLPSPALNRESNSADATTMVVRQDDVDPDNMTYEELQTLGEAIGTESRGLSEELISYLQSSKYKTGFFSRKEKHEECVICCMPYKNRDQLITLPCKHQYHCQCVTRWLKLNKACPVCNEEVFG